MNGRGGPTTWLRGSKLDGRATTVVVTGVVFLAGVLLEVDLFNGPPYCPWWWQDLGLARTAALFLPPMLLVHWSLTSPRRRRTAGAERWGLAGLAVACFLFQLAGVLAHPQGLTLIREIVTSPSATSYFTDALGIGDVRAWLASFHTHTLGQHSSTHPPGPILYWWVWIRLLGPETGALAGGLAVGALAAAGVPLVYRFGRLWTAEERPRLAAAAFYAMLPALVVFFPEFDQVYPILAMLLILTWQGALTCSLGGSLGGSLRRAVAFGALLFVATLFAYNLLAVGAPLALFTAWWLARGRDLDRGRAWRRLFTSALAGLAAFAALHLAFSAATGFRPWAGFLHALDFQAGMTPRLHRAWLECVVLDPYDFMLGSGILAAPLLVAALRRAARSPERPRRREDVASLLAFAAVATIDLTGLLRAETARVWLFLQPLVAVPVGLELARFAERPRMAWFWFQWLVLVVIRAKIEFIQP